MAKTQITTIGKALGAACVMAFSMASHAQIAPFSDDFEGYGTAGVPVPTDFTPWFGFSDNGGFSGGYVFAPSTAGPQISALGYNGTDNQYWNVYANYDNVNVHDRTNCAPCSPNLQEQISVFYEQNFTGADTAGGDTWVFSFDYREADVPPAGNTEVGAFIRVFDPIFNVLYETTLDTSGSSEWQEGRLAVTLDPAWVNGKVQIGFYVHAQEYEDSGMFYDNVNFVQAQPAEIAITQAGGFGNVLHPQHFGQFLTLGTMVNDVVRVVVYSEDTSLGDPNDLDATQVDLDTLRFGPANGKIDPTLAQQTNNDYNSDGLDDARVRFYMSELGFACEDTEGTITGQLLTGETFVGNNTFTTDCDAQCH